MTNTNLKRCARCGQPHTRCAGHIKNGPRKGQPCMRYPRKGATVCRNCGGNAPQVIAAAIRRRELQAAESSISEYFAARPELLKAGVSTEQALTEQLQRWLARVVYLNAIVHSLPAGELKQRDMSGKFEKPSVWFEMLAKAESELRETARVMDVGKVGDRLTVAVEGVAGMLEATLRAVLGELGLTPAQEARVPDALRASLRAVEGGES